MPFATQFSRILAAAALALCAVSQAAAQTQEYADCLEQARDDPVAARERAARWAITGGGSEARHCGAIAMIGLGAERQAAAELTEIGAEATDLTAEDRAGALTLAGDLWMRLDLSTMARRSFERAKLLMPDNREARIGLARAAAAQAQWPDALKELDALMDADPLDVEAMTLRAAARRASKDFAGAHLDAARATDLAPAAPLTWFERGAAARAKGDDIEARESWLRASMLDPTGPIGDMARFNLQRMILQK